MTSFKLICSKSKECDNLDCGHRKVHLRYDSCDMECSRFDDVSVDCVIYDDQNRNGANKER